MNIKQIIQNEQNDEYVYCTKCKHFRLSDKNTPYCKYENICNINNCEDSLELKDRPYYKPKNIFEKLADTVVDNDNLKRDIKIVGEIIKNFSVQEKLYKQMKKGGDTYDKNNRNKY